MSQDQKPQRETHNTQVEESERISLPDHEAGNELESGVQQKHKMIHENIIKMRHK